MQQLTVTKADFVSVGEEVWLAFKPKSVNAAVEVCDTLTEGKEYILTVKRKGRSLGANAYCWTLIGKLSDKLQTDANDIYRAYLPDVGGNYEIIPVREDRIEAWERVWCSGHIGRMIEDLGPCRTIKGYHNVRTYYASSDFDSRQMARLIELVVADCKQLGIETMTPRELDALVSRWGEVM